MCITHVVSHFVHMDISAWSFAFTIHNDPGEAISIQPDHWKCPLYTGGSAMYFKHL